MDAETRAYLDQTLGVFRDEVSRGFANLHQEFGTLRKDFGTLREDFGTLRKDFGTLKQEFGAVQETVGALQQGLEYVRGGVGALKQEFGTVQEKVGSLEHGFGTVCEELATLRSSFDELRLEVRESAIETGRHFDVVAEDLRHDIRGIAEGVIALSERVDRLDVGIHTEMRERFIATQAVVRVCFSDVRRDLADLRSQL
ncbi:MAG TPA: hypothetical protein VMT97_05135 [Terriglobales bacterium]|nr:hypothetical protein [Terriglobales bacterium]